MRTALPCILLLFAVATPAPSSAGPAEARPWAGPTAAGAGRTGRILRLDLTGIALNPAAVSSQPLYTFGLQYDSEPRRRSHNISVGGVDSKTSPLALGTVQSVEWARPDVNPLTDLAWYPTDTEPPDDKQTINRTWIALGYGLLDRRLNVGLGLNIFATRRAIRPNQRRVSMNLGVVGFPIKSLGLQVSVRNLIPTKMSIAPIVLSTGAAFLLEDTIFVEVDADVDFSSYEQPTVDLHGGVVVRIWTPIASTDGKPHPTFEVRGGYFSEDGFDQHHVTWGLGWVGTQGQLHYSMGVAAGTLAPVIRNDKEQPGRITHTITLGVSL